MPFPKPARSTLQTRICCLLPVVARITAS
jgi:hypothetical protein